MPPRQIKRSIVWNFFTPTVVNGRIQTVKCTTCNTTLRFFRNTTNLLAHLKRRHSLHLSAKLKSSEGEETAPSNAPPAPIKFNQQLVPKNKVTKSATSCTSPTTTVLPVVLSGPPAKRIRQMASQQLDLTETEHQSFPQDLALAVRHSQCNGSFEEQLNSGELFRKENINDQETFYVKREVSSHEDEPDSGVTTDDDDTFVTLQNQPVCELREGDSAFSDSLTDHIFRNETFNGGPEILSVEEEAGSSHSNKPSHSSECCQWHESTMKLLQNVQQQINKQTKLMTVLLAYVKQVARAQSSFPVQLGMSPCNDLDKLEEYILSDLCNHKTS